MNKINNRKSIIFLIIAWLFLLISLYLEVLFGKQLFSRAGSLMVLLAVLSKYNLLRSRDEYHSDQLKRYSQGDQVNFKEIHPQKSHHYLETIAHITVVIGTIIWGYGDLLFS